jgi:hypothetical protein
MRARFTVRLRQASGVAEAMPDKSARQASWRAGSGTGDGALHVGVPGREPTATKARKEIGAIETTALGNNGGIWLKTKHVTILGLTLSQ